MQVSVRVRVEVDERKTPGKVVQPRENGPLGVLVRARNVGAALVLTSVAAGCAGRIKRGDCPVMGTHRVSADKVTNLGFSARQVIDALGRVGPWQMSWNRWDGTDAPQGGTLFTSTISTSWALGAAAVLEGTQTADPYTLGPCREGPVLDIPVHVFLSNHDGDTAFSAEGEGLIDAFSPALPDIEILAGLDTVQGPWTLGDRETCNVAGTATVGSVWVLPVQPVRDELADGYYGVP